MAVAGRDDQIVLLAWRQADSASCGSMIRRNSRQSVDLALPGSPLITRNRIGAARVEAADDPSDDQFEIDFVLDVDEIAQLRLDQAALFR